MQRITLHSPPEDEPWTVEEFLQKTEYHCHHAALELNRRSLMVEEAVEEVLELVRKAGENSKENEDENCSDGKRRFKMDTPN